ncbi:MAG: glycosyltransferase [Legionellaceae bacterium]|nr:glycosyltransferase [Legionellaceae bacterium]
MATLNNDSEKKTNYSSCVKDNLKYFNWNSNDILYFLIYLTILLIIALNLPKNEGIYRSDHTAIISFGVIGIWRYSWWLNHVIRSVIYGRIVFPRRRLLANQLWDSGWRPSRLFFMMTTFQELQTTTNIVLKSIMEECNQIHVPIKLFIGTGTESDEMIIENFFKKQKSLTSFEVIMIRQKQPGKRYAIGETLRAIHRHGLTAEDLVVFMDGDTYFQSGCLRLCLPFFQLLPRMQALTTHERAIVKRGPTWVKKWLDMRFAQRDFTMQSYAISNKILTLTGRMSIFRGKHVCESEFINIIENDRLQHWLWGDYRFLSGDDKSTWYYLLKKRANMTYIPDATTITIEYIDGSAITRMKENLRRWSGNTLRNGARAIALGPRTVGYFIWWCLIDQRCSIWTMIIGHITILTLAVSKSYTFLFISLLWIAFSRLCLACMLFLHTRRIDMSFPFLIYINQLMSTITKIYILFRLPQQRWKNRGDQRSGFETQLKWRFKGWVATYLTLFYCMCCLLFILIYLNLISLPTMGDIKTFN